MELESCDAVGRKFAFHSGDGEPELTDLVFARDRDESLDEHLHATLEMSMVKEEPWS